MKRYVLGETPGVDSWQAEIVNDAPLGPKDVRVDMRAWSLNYRDLMVAEGTYGGRRLAGLVPLSDGAGEVIEIGSEVSRFKVGDNIATCFFRDWHEGDLTPAKGKTARGGGIDGVLAERMVFGEESIVRAPENLSNCEAATLPCAGLTAWHALYDAHRLQPGQTVLVQGTGGVSTFALQFAKAGGARVIVTSSSNDKLSHAEDLGADERINYNETPDWERAAFELTGGAGVDMIVEVGGSDTLPRSLRAVRYGGTVAVIGVLSGGQVQFPVGFLFSKNVQMKGIYVGSRTQFEAMNRAIEVNDIHPVVDREFGFDDAVDALRFLQKGEHVGKVVIVR